MSLSGRITELAAKHQKLDHEIHTEQKRPSADTIRLAELKKMKLRIKEELRQLRSS